MKNKFATSLFIFLLVFQSFAQSESLPCVDLNKRQPTTEVENSALVQNLELVNESFHCTLPAVGETRSFSGLLNGVRQDFALKPLSTSPKLN